jgi:hypothetical protein
MTLPQQVLLDLVAPPIGACLWWLSSWGNARTFQGGEISERTKNWLKKGFVLVLVAAYFIMFGITLYAHLGK